jgi:hypothetical protein
MKHLIRKQFADCTWDAADLDAAAEFWLRLYEEAARTRGFPATAGHATEVRLRGFPRHAGDALVQELARRAAASDFDDPEVGLTDPDTLSVSSGLAPDDRQPPVGLGLAVLAGEPFDGLLAEFRFRVTAAPGGLFGRSKVQATLVLIGELRGGRFVLKAVWRSGNTGWEDDVVWSAAWPSEAEWFAGFDRFRESGEVPASLAKTVFTTRGEDRTGGLMVKLIRVPLGEPRLGGLLVRWLIFAGLLGVIGYHCYEQAEAREWAWAVLFGAWGLFVAWVFSLFVRHEAKLFFVVHRQFVAAYTRLYEDSVRLVPLTRPEAGAAPELDNPWARKYTADLEAAGFPHGGDFRVIGGGTSGVFRVFGAPDGVTYLSLLFQTLSSPEPEQAVRTWPAAVVLVAYTFYPDGGRAASVSGRHLGYRRKRTGPETVFRVFPHEPDPVEFVRRHAATAAAFADETGRSPLRHERFDLFVRRQEALNEEERRLFADNPYTWGDHLRWYLQSPRREYRG